MLYRPVNVHSFSSSVINLSWYSITSEINYIYPPLIRNRVKRRKENRKLGNTCKYTRNKARKISVYGYGHHHHIKWCNSCNEKQKFCKRVVRYSSKRNHSHFIPLIPRSSYLIDRKINTIFIIGLSPRS